MLISALLLEMERNSSFHALQHFSISLAENTSGISFIPEETLEADTSPLQTFYNYNILWFYAAIFQP